ncbi:MAG: hypothetical protein QXM96_03825 [Candidatus Woesearchaeota archaeon]
MKRKSYEIKEEIILSIKEGPSSYAKLERKIDTGFITIKNSCEELSKYGLIKIEKKQKHSSNGKPYYAISLTDIGIEYAKKLEKKNS